MADRKAPVVNAMPVRIGHKDPWASMQLSPITISVAALIRTPGQMRQQFPISILPSPSADQTVSRTFRSGVAITVAWLPKVTGPPKISTCQGFMKVHPGRDPQNGGGEISPRTTSEKSDRGV